MKYRVLSLLASTVFLVGSTEKSITIHKEYYPEGNIKTEVSYKNGIQHGWEKEYDQLGMVTYESKWENGKRVGRSFEYQWIGIRIFGIVEHHDTNRYMSDGIDYTFFNNGSLKYETHYKEGKKILRKEFFTKGRLKSISQYKDDRPHGEARVYYPNGQLRFRSRPKDGYWKAVEEYRSNGVRVK